MDDLQKKLNEVIEFWNELSPASFPSGILGLIWKNLMKNRIKNSVALLDKNVPNWRSKIDLETLDMSDSDRCILGQIYGTGELNLANEDHAFLDELQKLWIEELSCKVCNHKLRSYGLGIVCDNCGYSYIVDHDRTLEAFPYPAVSSTPMIFVKVTHV